MTKKFKFWSGIFTLAVIAFALVVNFVISKVWIIILALPIFIAFLFIVFEIIKSYWKWKHLK
jgi:hypothetical protein